jgi:hypothetical protein
LRPRHLSVHARYKPLRCPPGVHRNHLRCFDLHPMDRRPIQISGTGARISFSVRVTSPISLPFRFRQPGSLRLTSSFHSLTHDRIDVVPTSNKRHRSSYWFVCLEFIVRRSSVPIRTPTCGLSVARIVSAAARQSLTLDLTGQCSCAPVPFQLRRLESALVCVEMVASPGDPLELPLASESSQLPKQEGGRLCPESNSAGLDSQPAKKCSPPRGRVYTAYW